MPRDINEQERAIEEALSRIGEPITEAQAKRRVRWKTANARTACSPLAAQPRRAACSLAPGWSPRSE